MIAERTREVESTHTKRPYTRWLIPRFESLGSVVWLSIGTLTLLAAGFIIGLGSALLLAGTWLLSVGISRVSPWLGIPTSWAIAIVSEMTVVLLMSASVALVSPHTHGAAVNLSILSAPIFIAAALLIIAARMGRRAVKSRVFFDRIAVIVSATVVTALAGLSVRGTSYGVAWAMSGDARNHLLIMRATLFNGGITVDQLRSYPAGFNALAAVVSGSTSRADLSNGELLVHDIHALVGVYAVLVIAVACMVVAVLSAFITRSALLRGRSGITTSIVLLIAAMTAVSPLVLGTTLVDGFFSAYGALALSLASIAIALKALDREIRSPLPYAFLAPGALVLFVSWPILAIIPIALATFVAFVDCTRLIRERSAIEVKPRSLVRWLPHSLPMLSALAICVVTLQNLSKLKASFSLSGSTTPPNIWALPIIALISVSLALISSKTHRTFMLAVVWTIVVGTGVVLWLMHVPGGWQDLRWSYYSHKTLWLLVSSLIWVPFVPLIYIADRVIVAGREDRHVRNAISLGLAALAVIAGMSITTTAAEPLSKAAAGWQQPTAEVMSRVLTVADDNRAFVLWDVSDQGDDRLGNFWAAFTWTTTPTGLYQADPAMLPGGFAYWAYFYTEQIQDLCKVVNAYPEITVVTGTSGTLAQLNRSCGAGPYQVEVVAPITADSGGPSD